MYSLRYLRLCPYSNLVSGFVYKKVKTSIFFDYFISLQFSTNILRLEYSLEYLVIKMMDNTKFPKD